MNDHTIKPAIVWFRQDLRLADNPALDHACRSGAPIVAVYVFDELSPDIRPMGAAQKWWLHHSLAALADDLDTRGNRLIFRRGAAEDVVTDLAAETGAQTVYWNRRYGDGEEAVDSAIKLRLENEGLDVTSFDGILMHEPSKVRTGSGKYYKVYTPFWKNLAENLSVRTPLGVPETISPANEDLTSDTLDDWHLLPTAPDWAGGIRATWTPGETAAHADLDAFLSDDLQDYDTARDRPGPDRTSRMSPRLRHGEVSPHQLWHAAQDGRRTADGKARETWLKELVWREFSYHLLHHNPDLHERNFNPKFDDFEWREDAGDLKAWQKGQTGYPIVDAGMRQLWNTGWMHNRVRMIAGSFLVKHLLIDWREGERWFWDCLVDGDPASNAAQWQWVGGTGADASPYFRVFNPIIQAQKFDPEGTYIQRHVPELRNLPAEYLPAPWDAPQDVLDEAGIELGKTYPRPIIEHKKGRERALDTLAALSAKPSEKDD